MIRTQILFLFSLMTACSSFYRVNLETSSSPQWGQRRPNSEVSLQTEPDREFSILKKLGVEGRIFDDSTFSQTETNSSYARMDSNFPVQLPGFVIEQLPKDSQLDRVVMAEILNSKKIEWSFLLEPQVLKTMRELIETGNIIIVSRSICGEKAVAFGEGHALLRNWQKVFSFKLQGAILMSSCITPHGFLHEAFHLRQYAGKNVPIGLQALANKVSMTLEVTDAKAIGSIVYPFIEAQASYYAIKKMRELYPQGKTKASPFFDLGEHTALDYYSMNFRWMHGRVNMVTGESQGAKYRAMQEVYSEVFFLDRENYLTSPMGFYRMYCWDSERSRWLVPNTDSRKELKIEISQGDWEKIPPIKMEECDSATKETNW